jgi:hypothetical protein
MREVKEAVDSPSTPQTTLITHRELSKSGAGRRALRCVTIQVRYLQVFVAVAAQRVSFHVIGEAKSEGPRSEATEKKAADHLKREIADRKGGGKYQNPFLPPFAVSCFER